MKLTIDFPIPASEKKIQHQHTILTLGSCFSDAMGERLQRLPMNVDNQPLGTIFHPNAILRSIGNDALKQSDCYALGDFFVHPDYHSVFTETSPAALCAVIDTAKDSARSNLQAADWVLLTFGTAFYYEDRELKRPISNCHKQPSHRFEKRISTAEEIVDQYTPFFKAHPNKNFILSVSPVRHTRDGVAENALSKAILRVAVATLQAQFSHVHYFPAFEIMVDELRDYRFYSEDLIHPSKQAENYIYERFTETYFDRELKEIAVQWSKYYATIHHHPHPIKSKQHERVLTEIYTELTAWEKRVNVTKIRAEILALMPYISGLKGN